MFIVWAQMGRQESRLVIYAPPVARSSFCASRNAVYNLVVCFCPHKEWGCRANRVEVAVDGVVPAIAFQSKGLLFVERCVVSLFYFAAVVFFHKLVEPLLLIRGKLVNIIKVYKLPHVFAKCVLAQCGTFLKFMTVRYHTLPYLY